MEKLLLGGIIGALVLLVIALAYAFGAFLFMICWNAFMPVVWAAAPKLTFWVSMAAVVLLGIIFHRPTIVTKDN